MLTQSELGDYIINKSPANPVALVRRAIRSISIPRAILFVGTYQRLQSGIARANTTDKKTSKST